MSSAYLNARLDERAGLTDLVQGIYDRCAEAGREPSAEERMQLERWGGQVRTLDAEIAELETTLNANRRFEQVLNRVADQEEATERAVARRAEAPAPEVRHTLGEAFVHSDAFLEYRMRGTSDRFEVEDIFELEERAPIILDTAATYPPKVRWDGPPEPRQLTPFLSVIGRERVSTGSFDYVVWGQATGVALVPEKLAKPEVELVPTLTTDSLDTYAGWVQVTRQALEDSPRIRSQIETRLRQNLARVLETAAIDVVEMAAIPATVADDLAGIREAVGVVEAAGYSPNAVALNPADYAALDVTVMGGTLLGPSGPGSYWGLRPIPVPGLAAGKAIVGDLAAGVTWFDRGTTDIYLTDSHVDNFIKNIFVILAEARAAFAVTAPAALASVSITQPVVAAASSKKS